MTEQRGCSVFDAAVNLSKLCIGAGVLALPYAVQKGGVIFAPLCIGVVAVWNGVACSMIIECKQSLVDSNIQIPPTLSSTYSKIAYAGAGNIGVFFSDFSIIVTLLGVCTAYQITFGSLMEEIPGVPFTKTTLILLSGLMVYPMSCAKNIGILSMVSFTGLISLLLGIFSILIYGSWAFGSDVIHAPLIASSTTITRTLPLFPESLTSLSSIIGVSTFCFGLCSLAFPVEESMQNKEDFWVAVKWSLVFVWSLYCLIGDAGALLYLHDEYGIHDNILNNLPGESLAASLVRLSIAFTCVLTFPLAFLPPAQMLEREVSKRCYKLLFCCRQQKEKFFQQSASHRRYQSIDEENDVAQRPDKSTEEHDQHGYRYFEESIVFSMIFKGFLIAFCTVVATTVPCFGSLISVLGCFTVAILSFILPPMLHLLLITKPNYSRLSALSGVANRDYYVQAAQAAAWNSYFFDVALTALGVIISAVATIVTASAVLIKLENGGGCS